MNPIDIATTKLGSAAPPAATARAAAAIAHGVLPLALRAVRPLSPATIFLEMVLELVRMVSAQMSRVEGQASSR